MNIAAAVGISSIKEEHSSEVKQCFPGAAVTLESSKCKEHGHIEELCPSPSDLSCVSCDMLSSYSPLNYDSAVDGKSHKCPYVFYIYFKKCAHTMNSDGRVILAYL